MTELAGLAGVSAKTVQALEYRSRAVSVELKYKIVNALNARPIRRQAYKFADLFPSDREAED